MNIFSRPRAAGKTHAAIMICCETGSKMVCASEQEARRVNETAARLGLKEQFPGAVSMHNCKSLAGCKLGTVVVDNADLVLSAFIGAEVKWVTVDGPPAEICGNKAERRTIAKSLSQAPQPKGK